jgi:hypothetical protein
MKEVIDGIAAHYGMSECYSPTGLTALDDRLERYLTGVVSQLIHSDPNFEGTMPTPATVRGAVGKKEIGLGAANIFENLKFARFMKGRLWFFSHDVSHFNSPPLIRTELNRMRKNFLEAPLAELGRRVSGREAPWQDVMNFLHEQGFSSEEITAMKTFHLQADPDTSDSDLRTQARAISETYDDFLPALEHLAELADATPALQ